MKTRIKFLILSIATIIVLVALSANTHIVKAELSNDIFSIGNYGVNLVQDCFGNFVFYDIGAGLWIEPSLMDNLESITITDPDGNIYPAVTEQHGPDSLGVYLTLYSPEKPAGNYSITVTKTDTSYATETLYISPSDISSTTPVVVSPIEGQMLKDTTPLFEWAPFSFSEENSSYMVELFGDGIEWRAGNLPSDITSLLYNFDGSAPMEELPPGSYSFFLFASEWVSDLQNRSSTTFCNFEVIEGRDIFQHSTGARLIIPGGEGEMSFPANFPFFIAHGWAFDTENGEGPFINNSYIKLYLDGGLLNYDKISKYVDEDYFGENQKGLVKYFIYNFPTGLAGPHLIEVEYWAPCGLINTECDDPKEQELFYVKSWMVTFE